jgi:hypothetical protein
MAKAIRKSISTKTRFEVFKRDCFTCQYCGNHPPAVVLEPDHIDPVANGGTNDMNNLITACFDCNRGKAARLLTDVPQSLIERAEEIKERELQIKGYQKLMKSVRNRLDRDALKVCAVYELYIDGMTLTPASLKTVRSFLEKLDLQQVIDAMEGACTRSTVKRGQEFKYFCGICWNIIKGTSYGSR